MLLVLVCIIALTSSNGTAKTSSSSNLPDSAASSSSGGSAALDGPKEMLLRDVTLEFKWRKVGFGNVMEADFTVDNPTSYSFKDFEIKCTHSAPSGTIIDSNTRTVYELVGPKSKRVIKNMNMGFIQDQASGSRCEITDLTFVP